MTPLTLETPRLHLRTWRVEDLPAFAALNADPRVALLEKTNARFLTAEHLRGARAPITLTVIDVSFISVTLILPAVLASAFGASSFGQKAPRKRDLLVLVKPQFEAGRQAVGKGGIVRDPQVQQSAVAKVRAAVSDLGGRNVGVMESPILGMEGNREFFLHAEF